MESEDLDMKEEDILQELQTARDCVYVSNSSAMEVEEKSSDEGEKVQKADDLAPPKVDSTEDSKSPLKESPKKSSKSPKKSVGEEEPNTVQN